MRTEAADPPHTRPRHLAFLLLSALSIVCYAAYFIHLRADFPAASPWNDWAKFTDEGWYGGAALRQTQTGHWYTPGTFNPAVGLPAWPLLLTGWFRIAGPGMAAARALSLLLFGTSLLLLFALLRPHCGRTIAAAAVLLTLLNPFCFAFHRLAILEPMVVLLFLLALWIATATEPRDPPSLTPRAGIPTGIPTGIRAALVGCLLTAMVLTKTTAIVLAPALFYQLWACAAFSAGAHYQQPNPAPSQPLNHTIKRNALLLPAIAATTALVLWLTYFLFWVRPHYLSDFNQLFTINTGKAHGRILLQVMAQALSDGLWINGILFPLALLFFAASLRFLRELWRIPLFGSAVLALACYIGFIGWHTWFQPRYYLICVAPMMVVLALGLHALQRRARPIPHWNRPAYHAALLVLAVAAATMAIRTARDLLQPRYTSLHAAQHIAAIIQSDPAHAPRLLAGPADNLALFTGIAPVNPEYAAVDLPTLLQQQQPGWYAAYTPLEDGRTEQLRQIVALHPVARYHVFEDPDHRALVLYRISPQH